jgi:16S rRNA processing protein RimM
MGRPEPTHLVVGRIERPHGIKGEVVVRSLTDHPGGVFSPGVFLSVGTSAEGGPDPDAPRLRIESARPHKGGYLVRFGGMEDRNQVEGLRRTLLFRPLDDLEPLDEGEVFFHQLVGLTASTAEGDELGLVSDVLEIASGLLLEVRRRGRPLLVPWAEEIVVEVDVPGGSIILDLPDGLLEVNE